MQVLRNDITDIKVSVGKMESLLHSTPCPYLANCEDRFRDDIRRLHEKDESHIREHHSSTSLRNNWLAWIAIIVTLFSNVIPKWFE